MLSSVVPSADTQIDSCLDYSSGANMDVFTSAGQQASSYASVQVKKYSGPSFIAGVWF